MLQSLYCTLFQHDLLCCTLVCCAQQRPQRAARPIDKGALPSLLRPTTQSHLQVVRVDKRDRERRVRPIRLHMTAPALTRRSSAHSMRCRSSHNYHCCAALRCAVACCGERAREYSSPGGQSCHVGVYEGPDTVRASVALWNERIGAVVVQRWQRWGTDRRSREIAERTVGRVRRMEWFRHAGRARGSRSRRAHTPTYSERSSCSTAHSGRRVVRKTTDHELKQRAPMERCCAHKSSLNVPASMGQVASADGRSVS